ncbi:MAG: CAP domain-containing protein [Candidatus Ornithomonoglobus sp.]
MKKITTLLIAAGLIACSGSAMAKTAVITIPVNGSCFTVNGQIVQSDGCITKDDIDKLIGSFGFGCINGENKPGSGDEEMPELPQATEAPAETEEPQETAAPEQTDAPTETEAPAVPTEMPTAAPTEAPAPQAPSSVSALEKEVFELVNKERAANGLHSLTWADDLAAVARAHSQDMIDNNYFSHTNLSGESPFDRLRKAGISYTAAAENIAYGQRTPQAVMDAWMNSSGHRANILNSRVKEIGVGAAKASNGTIYWTQVFAAR